MSAKYKIIYLKTFEIKQIKLYLALKIYFKFEENLLE